MIWQSTLPSNLKIIKTSAGVRETRGNGYKIKVFCCVAHFSSPSQSIFNACCFFIHFISFMSYLPSLSLYISHCLMGRSFITKFSTAIALFQFHHKYINRLLENFIYTFPVVLSRLNKKKKKKKNQFKKGVEMKLVSIRLIIPLTHRQSSLLLRYIVIMGDTMTIDRKSIREKDCQQQEDAYSFESEIHMMSMRIYLMKCWNERKNVGATSSSQKKIRKSIHKNSSYSFCSVINDSLTWLTTVCGSLLCNVALKCFYSFFVNLYDAMRRRYTHSTFQWLMLNNIKNTSAFLL